MFSIKKIFIVILLYLTFFLFIFILKIYFLERIIIEVQANIQIKFAFGNLIC
jgi:hypothetical protein